MNLSELIDTLNLRDIEIKVKLIKPIRNGEYYTSGRVEGFKPALLGAVKKNRDQEFRSSSGPHLLKKAKVLVVYNIAEWGKKEHSDWVDADNCEFEIIKNLKQ